METSIVCYFKSLPVCAYIHMYMEQINWNRVNSSAYLLSLFILLSHIHFYSIIIWKLTISYQVVANGSCLIASSKQSIRI